MKKIVLLLGFLSIIFGTAYGQKISNEEIVQIYKLARLTGDVGYELQPNVSAYDIEEIKKYTIGSDSIVRRFVGEPVEKVIFNKKDRRVIKRQLRAMRSFKWDTTTLRKYGIDNLALPDPTKQLDKKGVYRDHRIAWLTKPIFIRNDSICFVFYDSSCGPLCGSGFIDVYKKEEGVWKRWWTLVNWVS